MTDQGPDLDRRAAVQTRLGGLASLPLVTLAGTAATQAIAPRRRAAGSRFRIATRRPIQPPLHSSTITMRPRPIAPAPPSRAPRRRSRTEPTAS